MSELACTWSVDEFRATAINTGENRLVRVQGNGTCPTTGFSVTLDHTNPGFNPERQRIYLELKESPPDVGGDALTTIAIDETFDAPPGKTEVEIRHVGVLTIREPG